VEVLSKKLEDVWWNKHKLQVNRALFDKGDKKVGDNKVSNQPQRSTVVSDMKVSNDLSFKSLLLGKDGGGGTTVDKDGMVVNGDGGRKKMRALTMGDTVPLELFVHEATVRELRHSRVGFFKESMEFQSFNDRLVVEGQHEVKATSMGGNMVLLQGACEGELEEVMKINKQWWDQCFLKIIPWNPKLLSESREIWIQIYGIPLHVWEEGSFKMVAGRFGVFLDFDEATVAKQRLDVARVKLRTMRRGMIDTVLQLLVQGERYDVWVVEERCSCGEEVMFEGEEGHRSVEVTRCSSGEEVWRGEDRELFSDGRSESDGSGEYDNLGEECMQVQSAMAVGKEGLGNTELQGQHFLEATVGENLSGNPMEVRHVESEGDSFSQVPDRAVIEVDNGVRGLLEGPTACHSNVLQKECEGVVDKGHVEGLVLGDPQGEVAGCSIGPVGPYVVQGNPRGDFVDGAEAIELIETAQHVEVDILIKDDVAVGGLLAVDRDSQLSEASSSSQ
jgi:hypothetical protein